MASSINASTSGAGGVITTADNTGILNLQTGGTTAITVDASQNVGIGTASPAAKFQVNGAIRTTYSGDTNYYGTFNNATGAVQVYANGDSAPLLFGTTSAGGSTATERMRIDSSGNVLVGTTSTSNSVVGLRFNNSVSSGFMQILSTKSISGELNFLLNYHNGTYVGGINYTNTATSFPTSSDIRLKKDIVDAPSATQKIDNIRIVSHGWKHDDEVVDFGIIAQDLYNVAPRAVTKGDDGEEIEKTWSVDYSKLVPMLIKAHQEQQTLIVSQSELINNLTARVTALEAK